MRGAMWLTALGCAILLSSSGCCGFLRDGGCGRGCGDSCGGCEGDCGPVRHPLRERVYSDDCGECSNCGARTACGSCGSCSECGDECGSCCQRNFCFHPFRWIGRLFYCGTWCGPSCGGTYWGESVSDPPDCSDPCTRGGHWTGRTGCANCNHGATHDSGEMSPASDGPTVQEDGVLEPAPPLKTPTKARRTPANSYDR
jgi:hypothetical protein